MPTVRRHLQVFPGERLEELDRPVHATIWVLRLDFDDLGVCCDSRTMACEELEEQVATRSAKKKKKKKKSRPARAGCLPDVPAGRKLSSSPLPHSS
jgi:hypothetical protein